MTAATALLQVLLVEDDLGDVALMESSASSFAELHQADGADTGVPRRNGYADAPRPDLVLLDLNMPRVDGRQVLAAIKADEQLKAIPVVVFTTSAHPADIVSSYERTPSLRHQALDVDEFDQAVAQIRNFYGHTVTLPRRP